MATATATTPLAALQALGQSVWLDDISRKMLKEGELKRLIEEDGLQGMTSNPSIFHKSISGGTDYDDATRQLVAEGKTVDGIYESLTVADIKEALDLFRPVYDRTKGGDGYVSLEVSPLLAHSTEKTIAEAKKLWALLDRPNAMIKIPGTPEGLPAIEECLFSGMNINVTLLFSVEAYEAVAHTYVKALKRRAEKGLPVDHIASVASFFVSRIDTETDKRIEAKIKATSDANEKAELEALLGKAAIANAKNAYAIYQRIFEGEEFAPLKAKNAKVQRVLWASVGTKNPKYPDTLYTAGLIGPETVSTMPRASYDAFKDHGQAASTLLEGMDEAPQTMKALAEAGVDFKDVTDKLLKDGVKLFADAFEELAKAILAKKKTFIAERRIGHTFALGSYEASVSQALDAFQKENAVKRMWDKDATLWKTEPEHVKIINNALGWLRVVDEVRPHAEELEAFGNEFTGPGFSHVVLMGMGGSSLCTEVLRRTFVPVSGHPVLTVLDSTVPAAIHRTEGAIEPPHSLFIVASKSGTTTEPSVFYAYFFDVVKKTKGANTGENFLAITDPGTLMEAQAKRDTFRRIFLNPSDIGGRYSALSYFGMVPAALMGLDVAAILDRAKVAMSLCSPEMPLRQNPGAALGAALGALAKQGRNKVTIITPPPFDALGLWIEQLIAESTGKEGTGILPVAGEPLSSPGVYGDDRVFVQIRLPDRPGVEEHPMLQALVEAGHPVIDLVVTDVTDLGAEFFRWEIATPLAGKILGINPFDQPNVQESKDNTKALLNEFKEKGSLGEPETVASSENLTLRADPGNKAALQAALGGKTGRDALVAALKAHFGRVKPGDYVAITQYFDESEARDETLQTLRTALRDTLKVATTTGYGPRFLHSTGQFHKGGPDTGVFLQLTADDGKDIPIPGQPFGFATLVKAQALGDLQSLTSRHRRAVNLDLGPDVDKGLKTLLTLIKEAVAK